MGLILAASSIAFITTEMDDLLVMFVLFGSAFTLRDKIFVVLGKYLGLAVLVFVSKTAASLLVQFPVKELLGLLGLVPIAIGVKTGIDCQRGGPAMRSAGEDSVQGRNLFLVLLNTLIITLANGGDNIAVFLSFFPSLSRCEFVASCVVFAVLQAVWCAIAIAVMSAKSLRDYISESRRVVIPFLYILLGIYIVIQNGTVLWLFEGR